MTRQMVAAATSTAPCGRLIERAERTFPSRVEHDHRQALSGADGWETVALPPDRTALMILPAIHCRRCKTLMDLVATIKPIGIHPGLNAYACTTCGHTDSELIVRNATARLAL